MEKTHCITNIKKETFTDYFLGVSISELLQHADPATSILLIDDQVHQYHQKKFRKYKKIILITSREQNKSWQYAGKIIEQMVAYEIDRSFTLIAVGGGLTTDIAGFIASVYMRGLRCIYVPTTLLNMVDAAIGGKTAVNWKGIKNIIGTIKQPDMVLFDIDFLSTLPVHELQYGMAEVIKYGTVLDKKLFTLLEHYTIQDIQKSTIIKDIIQQSLWIKKKIVERDPEEKNIRRVLNFGHTIGHAIEKSYRIPHGQSVAYGMVVACKISEHYLDFQETEKVIKLLEQYHLKTHLQYNPEKIYKALLLDKKRMSKTISFILTPKIGSCVIQVIPIANLHEQLCKCLS